MPLEAEQKIYFDRLPDLLPQAGKFVVIGDGAVVGVYDTYNDAMRVAYDRFGLGPFMVKQIEVDDRVRSFTRDLGPSCPT